MPLATAEYRTHVGYPVGAILRDVTLAEARAMECNRCGDCCDTTGEHVKTDPEVGLPLFVWTIDGQTTAFDLPEDRYAERYGRPLINPVIRGDGGLITGDEFEIDADGKPHRSFKCDALVRDSEDHATCGLYWNRAGDPERPYHCGSFPVHGLEADMAIWKGGEYIPHTSALPRCTWFALRIVGF